MKLPDFKGFHSQEVELPNDRKWSLEHYMEETIRRPYTANLYYFRNNWKITIDVARLMHL